MFRATSLIISKTWKQSKCPSAGKRIHTSDARKEKSSSTPQGSSSSTSLSRLPWRWTPTPLGSRCVGCAAGSTPSRCRPALDAPPVPPNNALHWLLRRRTALPLVKGLCGAWRPRERGVRWCSGRSRPAHRSLAHGPPGLRSTRRPKGVFKQNKSPKANIL